MRVTHSSWRRSSPGSRIRCTWPERAYSSSTSVVPSSDRLSVAITTSTPAFRWNASHESTTSISSRARSVMTSVIAAPVYELPRARLARARASRSSSARTRCSARTMPSISTSADASAAYAASSTRARAREREPPCRRRENERPVVAAERTERVAQARVDGERAVREALRERASSTANVVVERRRRGPPGTPRRGGSGAGSARTPDCGASRLRALRSSWATERNEKCRTSSGCHARNGTSPGASALWFPASTSTSRTARWATFWWAW